MKFKLVARKNPQKQEEAPKYYAQPEYNGMVDVDFIARQIAGRSSLTAGDIKNVLSNFLEEVPTYMLLGYSVKLNDFGTFRISFSSTGAESAKAFRTSMIDGEKIIYTPDTALKARILDSITYEQDKPADTKGGGEVIDPMDEPGGFIPDPGN